MSHDQAHLPADLPVSPVFVALCALMVSASPAIFDVHHDAHEALKFRINWKYGFRPK